MANPPATTKRALNDDIVLARPATTKRALNDDIVLARPQGVYTGGGQRKSKRSNSCNMPSSSAREYDVKGHRRALSLQPYTRDGMLASDAKAWTPKPLSDGTYGSPAMKDLCEEFGALAAEIVQEFAQGK